MKKCNNCGFELNDNDLFCVSYDAKVYHTYDCSLWKAEDGSWSIIVYNIDAAIQEGYSACTYCH